MQRGFRRGLARMVALAVLSAGCASAPGGASGADATDLGALTLVDLVGGMHSLDEYRGKVVLLDFWATWCGPCLESLPLYNGWQRDLGDRGLVVVAVSVDEEDAPVETFAGRYAPDVTVMRDRDGAVAARLGLPKMPTAYLIGRDGRLIARHAGFDDSGAAGLRDSILAALGAP